MFREVWIVYTLPSYSVQKTFIVSWSTQGGNWRFISLAEVCLETSPLNSQNLFYILAGKFFANENDYKDVAMTTSTAPTLTIQVPLRLYKKSNFSKKKQIATSRIG